MLISLAKPYYQDHIGRLQMMHGATLWNVYVTTGAIEKLARTAADDDSLLSAADTLCEIARSKLKDRQTLSDSIWIRALDIHDPH